MDVTYIVVTYLLLQLYIQSNLDYPYVRELG